MECLGFLFIFYLIFYIQVLLEALKEQGKLNRKFAAKEAKHVCGGLMYVREPHPDNPLVQVFFFIFFLWGGMASFLF